MPESASMPTQPDSTARATTSSQTSPAATVTRTPPQVGSVVSSTSACRPVVAIRTTVPGKPSSATTRLLPPATSRRSRPASSAALTVPTSSASDVASTRVPAGPPRRSVVRSARRVSDTNDGLGGAEDLLAAAGDLERDGRDAVRGLAQGAGHPDLDPRVTRGDHDRPGELA